MDRNSLRKRTKWKTLIQLNAIEKIFAMAHGDIGKVILAARCALEAYRVTGCPEILYIALTILVKLQVYDKELIARLLNILMRLNGHFLSLFSNTIFQGEGVTTYGLIDDEESSEYLLTVAGDLCFEVGNDIVRFVDVPVGELTLGAISACVGSTASVHMFLRHGADPYKILQVLETYPRDGQNEIAKLVARATPYPGKDLRALLDLPNPPTLKHLCKFVIRHRLLLNNWLPIGITALPLFPRLQEYIDLRED